LKNLDLEQRGTAGTEWYSDRKEGLNLSPREGRKFDSLV
jgi:hypothetical protein